jgi:hypothetical protein
MSLYTAPYTAPRAVGKRKNWMIGVKGLQFYCMLILHGSVVQLYGLCTSIVYLALTSQDVIFLWLAMCLMMKLREKNAAC